MAYFIPAPTDFAAIPDYQTNPFVSGLNLAVTGNTTFTVSAGCARSLTSDFVIQYPSYSPILPTFITANIANVGLNGVYPYTIASLGLTVNTVFPVYLVTQSSGTTGGSLSNVVAPGVVVATGNNFLPPNYDAFRRIGWVYVNSGTGNLIYMAQSGNSNDRIYRLESGIVALSAGAATVATNVDLTINAGIIPPIANVNAILGLVIVGNAANAYLRVFQAGEDTGNGMTGIITPTAAETLATEVECITGLNDAGNASVDYLVNNAGTSATIVVAGFVDSLGNTLV